MHSDFFYSKTLIIYHPNTPIELVLHMNLIQINVEVTWYLKTSRLRW